jgi:hypothetical protein
MAMDMPTAARTPPWSIVENPESFVIIDATGQALGYLYFEDEAGPAANHEAIDPGRSVADIASMLRASRTC